MNTLEKVEILGRSAQYDLCGEACGTEATRKRDDLGRWIYPAVLPDGQRVALLKVLLTNVCERNCAYCANRRSRDFRRVSFTPEELARTFEQMWRRGQVMGLFLSSGVCGHSGQAMDRMLATVEIIRQRLAFPGYIHLKILPGATQAHVERAMQLADRVSVNLEAPNPERLARIAPEKDFTTALLEPLRWVKRLREESGGRLAPAGPTTQFVVGAADEPDREILATADRLYRELNLTRAYFSAFQPVPDTPLADHPPTPLWREHRLYQSDWLLRKYGFAFEELIFDEEGNLPRQSDPKTMWAMAHPERFPIEVNRASREELLRVPGIGPRSAERIVRLRKRGKFRELSDLRRVGAIPQRAAPFVLLDGRRPAYQLPLWG
ncbi:MAG: putative DNA modification/repair radical SAM protein [Anaerolineae bacterium]|nr:putative DNA modification/repair radical SAM protein [Anaerolineae bacterium]